MRSTLGRCGALALVAGGAVWTAWLGFRPHTMGDYPTAYGPAMNALLTDHLGAFLAQQPLNGSGASILLRARAALVGKLLVGTQLAGFRLGALVCVASAGALSLWLARGARRRGTPSLAGGSVVGLYVVVPGLLDAVRFGHPEELLGAVFTSRPCRRPPMGGHC